VAAGVGALLLLGSGVATTALLSGAPRTGLVDSLARAGQAGGVGGQRSLLYRSYVFYDDRAAATLVAAVAQGIGFVALAFMLAYLATAVRGRTPVFRTLWLYVALAGGVLSALATIGFEASKLAAISSFLDGPRTVDSAIHIGHSTSATTAQLVGLVGSFALGLGWVVICLNAMRVGLLTRFMGTLGIICGALVVLPLLGAASIVLQTFWLGAVALLLLGRWPNGVPPAWSTAEATPWPTQQRVREPRRRRGAPAPEPEPEPEDAPAAEAASRPHPASKKKKRKRRA
jgi:hypothetical protein